MASAPTYPGVYIREIPSGVHTITGVATSITAFIGRAPRGPADGATVGNSFADYERQFGGLSLLSTMSFAARDFFLNGGSQAIIVRVHNGANLATITLPAGSPGNLVLEAANPGSWGNNLIAQVDYKTRPGSDATVFNLKVLETDPISRQAVNTEVFLNVSVSSSDPRFLSRVLEQSSDLVRVRAISTVRPLETPVVISPPGALSGIAASSGGDGSEIGEAQFTGQSQDAKKGLFALEKADLFNLLCIPPFSLVTDDPALQRQHLVSQAAAYCETR